MYCIRVGRYWLGREKMEYLSQDVISVERYTLNIQNEPGVTLWIKDYDKATLILADYLALNPHCRHISKIRHQSEMGKGGDRIVYKPEIPFE